MEEMAALLFGHPPAHEQQLEGDAEAPDAVGADGEAPVASTHESAEVSQVQAQATETAADENAAVETEVGGGDKEQTGTEQTREGAVAEGEGGQVDGTGEEGGDGQPASSTQEGAQTQAQAGGEQLLYGSVGLLLAVGEDSEDEQGIDSTSLASLLAQPEEASQPPKESSEDVADPASNDETGKNGNVENGGGAASLDAGEGEQKTRQGGEEAAKAKESAKGATVSVIPPGWRRFKLERGDVFYSFETRGVFFRSMPDLKHFLSTLEDEPYEEGMFSFKKGADIAETEEVKSQSNIPGTMYRQGPSMASQTKPRKPPSAENPATKTPAFQRAKPTASRQSASKRPNSAGDDESDQSEKRIRTEGGSMQAAGETRKSPPYPRLISTTARKSATPYPPPSPPSASESEDTTEQQSGKRQKKGEIAGETRKKPFLPPGLVSFTARKNAAPYPPPSPPSAPDSEDIEEDAPNQAHRPSLPGSARRIPLFNSTAHGQHSEKPTSPPAPAKPAAKSPAAVKKAATKKPPTVKKTSTKKPPAKPQPTPAPAPSKAKTPPSKMRTTRGTQSAASQKPDGSQVKAPAPAASKPATAVQDKPKGAQKPATSTKGPAKEVPPTRARWSSVTAPPAPAPTQPAPTKKTPSFTPAQNPTTKGAQAQTAPAKKQSTGTQPQPTAQTGSKVQPRVTRSSGSAPLLPGLLKSPPLTRKRPAADDTSNPEPPRPVSKKARPESQTVAVRSESKATGVEVEELRRERDRLLMETQGLRRQTEQAATIRKLELEVAQLRAQNYAQHQFTPTGGLRLWQQVQQLEQQRDDALSQLASAQRAGTNDRATKATIDSLQGRARAAEQAKARMEHEHRTMQAPWHTAQAAVTTKAAELQSAQRQIEQMRREIDALKKIKHYPAESQAASGALARARNDNSTLRDKIKTMTQRVHLLTNKITALARGELTEADIADVPEQLSTSPQVLALWNACMEMRLVLSAQAELEGGTDAYGGEEEAEREVTGDGAVVVGGYNPNVSMLRQWKAGPAGRS